jgi:hypothetical protein
MKSTKRILSVTIEHEIDDVSVVLCTIVAKAEYTLTSWDSTHMAYKSGPPQVVRSTGVKGLKSDAGSMEDGQLTDLKGKLEEIGFKPHEVVRAIKRHRTTP